MITSPGSISVLQKRSITCWPPVVTSTSPGSTSAPLPAITCAIVSRVLSRPSVGPYWSARADDSAATRAITAASVSAGKVAVSGSPPASEMTSGRSVIAIRSRIADDVITRVREANSPA